MDFRPCCGKLGDYLSKKCTYLSERLFTSDILGPAKLTSGPSGNDSPLDGLSLLVGPRLRDFDSGGSWSECCVRASAF